VRRREFIALLVGGAAAWPLAAGAQQPDRMRRIGVLMSASENDPEYQAGLAAFEEELQKLGWSQDRSIRIDRRWAPDVESTQQHAKELVGLKPDVILSQNTPTTASLLQHTRTIPIVFTNVSDPVGSGFVASLPRPGGNVTGFINLEGSLGSKWLELLKEIAPRVTRVALLFNPATAAYAEYYLKPLEAAAASFAVEAIAAPVHNTSELESVIATQAREPNGGLVVGRLRSSTFTVWKSPRWLHAIVFPLSIRIVSLLNSAACFLTGMTCATIFDAPGRMSIAS
jgi:ABC-type uncharacterized transport system substrate-binding protein